jgi:hypothetical protein
MLLDYITFQDPQNPSETINWLTLYAVQCRYEGAGHIMDEPGRTKFRQETLLASHPFINRAHELAGIPIAT